MGGLVSDNFDLSVILKIAAQGGAKTTKEVVTLQEAVDDLRRSGELAEESSERLTKGLIKQSHTIEDNTSVTEKNTGSQNAQRYALYEVAAAYGAVSASLIALGTTAVSAFGEVEAGFTKVERTSGAYGNMFQPIEDSLFSLSRAIPVTLQDLQDLAARGAQMGIAAGELDEFSNAMSRFVATSDTVDVNTVAESFGRISNLTGVTDWEALASAVSLVGVKGAATEAQILKTTQELAPFGVQAGMSAEEIIGLSGALASLAVPPERARSAISSLVSVVDKGVSGLNDKLPHFANLMGISSEEAAKLWKTDASQFIIEMSNALATTSDMTAVMSDLGLTEKRVSSVFNALATNAQVAAEGQSELEKQMSNANWAFQERGELARQFAPIEDDLISKQTKLANSMKEFAFTVAGGAEPAIKGLVDVITKLITGMTDLVDTPAGKFLAGMVVTVGTLTAVYTGLKAALALASAMQIAWNTATKAGAASGMVSQLKQLIGGFTGATVAAGSATAATNGFKVALASTGIGLAVVALGALATALMQVGGSAEDAFNKYVGTSAGLAGAIGADEVAYTEALASGLSDVAEAYSIVTPAVKNLTDSQDDNYEASYKTAELLGLGVTSGADKAKVSLNNLTMAIGENTIAWVRQSLMANEAFQKLVSSGGLSDLFAQTGADFDTAMKIALEGGQAGLVAYWQQLANTNDAAAHVFHSGAIAWIIRIGESLKVMWADLMSWTNLVSDFKASFGDADAQVAKTIRSSKITESLDRIWTDPVLKGNVKDFNNLLLGTGEVIKSVGQEAGYAAPTFQELGDELDYAADNAEGLGQGLDSVEEKLVSVTDYANELKGVLDRAFELDFSLEEAEDRTQSAIHAIEDQITKGKDGIQKQIDEIEKNVETAGEDATKAFKEVEKQFDNLEKARDKVASLRTEIRGLKADLGLVEADLSKKKYWLSVAIKMGDTQRAEQLQAEIAKGESDRTGIIEKLDKKQKELLTTEEKVLLGLVNLKDAQKDLAKAEREVIRTREIADKQVPILTRKMNDYTLELEGSSREAIENRKLMRNLNGSINDQVVAFANLGNSQSDILDYSVKLTDRWDKEITQLGLTEEAVTRYKNNLSGIKTIVDKVPRNVSTALEIKGLNASKAALKEWRVAVRDRMKQARKSIKATDKALTGLGSGLKDMNVDITAELYPPFPYKDWDSYLDALFSLRTNKTARDLSVKPTLPIKAEGGYTGPGGKYDPAGIVHKGEYVIPKRDVNQSTGLPYADAMGKLVQGTPVRNSYANGGFVNPSGGGPVDLSARSIQLLASAIDPRIFLDGNQLANSVTKSFVRSSNEGSN